MTTCEATRKSHEAKIAGAKEIVMRGTGTTLMVLKHGAHPMAEIEACQKRLSQANVALKGVVFNDVRRLADGSSAYRYGVAGYQYTSVKNKA